MERLVIVSNRVPSSASEISAGGLTVALKAALAESGGLWFGWNGAVSDNPSPSPQINQVDAFSLATMALSWPEFRGYYEEFSNRVLWPLFHDRLDLCKLDGRADQVYRQVNARFASALEPLLKKGDTIWVQDYHLIPLGKELRGLKVKAPLGFFLHIPFPKPDTLNALPDHRALLRDFCAYNLLGFQTAACAENFREAAVRYLGASVRKNGHLEIDDRIVEVGAFPVSIDTKSFMDLAGSPEVGKRVKRLHGYMHGRDWVCGVERLDYTKGLAERFQAFERLLEKNDSLHEKLSLVQIAAPSRESVAEYQEMRKQLELLSGQINGRFATFDWTPVRYLNKTYSQTQLAALYRVSRVGLVTPLRDGMNLVAKEYIASQDPEDPGVLVLSRFAGAAQELTEALLVNPSDISATAEAIEEALAMPLDERQKRYQAMIGHLQASDVHHWRQAFLKSLESAADRQRRSKSAEAA